ncbi:hypothetical protein [Oryza sativa Japonica Group]|uniref:Uncharacterized protein n=1 Tax=Oryza sativa subsp. japonica TaxID=39947 RepID=Q5N7E1_ORYSJ|nr:hypothetical protein [Oryza sativa Japonica Group]BAD82615.1 hypothetical protein [Oryza sativa Japonica Group]
MLRRRAGNGRAKACPVFQLPSFSLAELSLVDASSRRASNLLTLGSTEEDQQEADGAEDPALVFDVDDEGEMSVLLAAAAEYARRMRHVGMQVVAMTSRYPEVGFGEASFTEPSPTNGRIRYHSPSAAELLPADELVATGPSAADAVRMRRFSAAVGALQK